MIAPLLALLAVAVAILLSLAPMLKDEPPPSTVEDLSELEARRTDVVRALRDVELDFAMGKITEDDRERRRADLEGRAVRILAAIDERSEPPPERGA